MTSDFRQYLEFSERFVNLAETTISDEEKNALYFASIIFSWISIESFVNNMIDDFNQVPADMFPMHEKAFLLEKKLRFEDRGLELGKFIIDENQNDFRRLEEKIFFLIAKFSTVNNLRGETLWQKFDKFKIKRNEITHPRRINELVIDEIETKQYFEVAQEIINLISINVWKKKVNF